MLLAHLGPIPRSQLVLLTLCPKTKHVLASGSCLVQGSLVLHKARVLFRLQRNIVIESALALEQAITSLFIVLVLLVVEGLSGHFSYLEVALICILDLAFLVIQLAIVILTFLLALLG